MEGKRADFGSGQWPPKVHKVKIKRNPEIALQCAACLFEVKAPDGITKDHKDFMNGHICLKTDGTEWTDEERMWLFKLMDKHNVQTLEHWLRIRRKFGIDTF
jgi:hypothetical protein